MDNPNLTGQSGLVERAKAIILQPAQTWPQIEREAASPGELITRYAIPLIAIGPVAGFVGGQLFGFGMMGFSFKPGLMAGLTMAVMQFIMAIVAVVLIGLTADFLADKFGGTPNRTAAFKLVVYSLTPAWVAGILGLIPSLAALGIIASLYGLYLFYQGAAPLMKVPQDKAAGYTAVTTVAVIVLMFVANMLIGSVMAPSMRSMAGATALGSASEVTIPGIGKVDTAKMEEAGKRLEAAASGSAPAVDPAKLQALLPATLGSWTRTAVETNAAGAMGAQAEGTYKSGDKTLHLSVIDSSGLGAIAGMGAAMGAQHSREDADGYERAATVDGQFVIEKWNNKSNRGTFTQQVASRFVVTAEGDAGSIDELKAAVAAITPSLAGLAQ